MDDFVCEPLQLPTDRTRPAVPRYTTDRIELELHGALLDSLQRYAIEQDSELFEALLGGWIAVFARLSGQDDFVVSLADMRSALPVKDVSLRVRLRSDVSVATFLRQVASSVASAVTRARAVSAIEIDSDRSPVEVILAHDPRSLEMPALSVNRELSITLAVFEGSVSCTIRYANECYLRETVERFAECWKIWLSGVGSNTDAALRALPVLTDDDRARIVDIFNHTQSELSPHQVHELFEQQVALAPDAVAIFHGVECVTYWQLNACANRMARHLRECGVGPDQLVAICVDRSVDLIVAMFAVLKAGGAYVPLDPGYPAARLLEVLSNAQPVLLLTHSALQPSLPQVSTTTLAVDLLENRLAQYDADNLPRMSSQGVRNLAYVIHTSGSAGTPKGVMVEHAGVVNFLLSMQRCPGMQTSDCVLALTTISFDISGLEIYLPLICGARFVLADRAAAFDAQRLIELVDAFAVTVMQATPATWQLLLSAGWRGRRSLKALCGGEALRSELSGQLLQRVGSLWNLYGPTETTIWSSVREIVTAEAQVAVEPVGGPIANTQIYILDAQNQPVPIGVAGEVLIGGVGVARGYLNRPDLTTERFVASPLSADAADRLYRTGDLGRFRAEGSIDYLGRNDHQVKIRGYRIELGEIEARLVSHERLSAAVVIPREDNPGEKRLVAYVVSRDAAGEAPTADELRMHLKATLPEYMVPSAYVTLDRLPLTPNKKVDRRALPAPGLSAFASRSYEAPSGERETLLATLWQRLLGIERVGRRDNFFELGGHSLLIVQLLAQLRSVGWGTDVRQVFESATLADLATALQPAAESPTCVAPIAIPPGCEIIEPGMVPLIALDDEQIARIVAAVPGGVRNIQDIYPLTPLQEGILFHHVLDEKKGDTYVLPTVLEFDSRERLDTLIGALQAVIDRHDILRTAIIWEQLPRPAQVVYRKAALPLHVVELQTSVAEQLAEWLDPSHQHLDLRRAPLMQLTIAAGPHSAKWYGLLQTHHIVSDHESLELLLDEVTAHLEGRVEQLPRVAAYRDHVAHALMQAQAREAVPFFRGKLADVDEPTAPFGLLEVRGTGQSVVAGSRTIPPDRAFSIRQSARRLGVSAATLFHAAWALVTARTSGRDDVVFGSVLSGRLQGSVGAKQVLGMFINTLPLRIKLDGVAALDLVRQTQRELIALMSYEQASLATAQRCSGVKGTAPLFTALLNYVHSSAEKKSGRHVMASGIEVIASPEWTNYPVVVTVNDQSGPFVLTAQTNLAIEPTRILDYLETAIDALVQAVERAPETPAATLAVLPSIEYEQVIEKFNATRRDYPREKLIHERFEEQARLAPHAHAVVCGQTVTSYAELNRRADRLAGSLRGHGIRPDDRVVVYTERGVELVVALLAVLKAGGAYVPLDPSYPEERLAYMIGDCTPVALLTQERFLGRLKVDENLPVILIDALPEAGTRDRSDDQRLPSVTPQHLAYVIYTSGSTGTPKGVMVTHETVSNLISWHGAAFDLKAGSVTSCVAAIGFDATVWEIWPALSVGATLVMAPPELSGDAEAFLTWWAAQPLDVSFLPTPMAELAFTKGTHNAHLRTLLVGGDRLRSAVPREHFTLVNNYGPTESTVVATSGELDPKSPVRHIGRPIANTRIYILDAHRQPVPVGVQGEMYIGGEGLARGYLNRPQLTQERFLPDPFRTDAAARMYRTGDVARWRDDGTIEFGGRNDDQVKIRGYRIELGEIEARLAALREVNEVVVLAREDAPDQKRLVAYLTCDDASGVTADILRNQLQSGLPDYMIPSAFVILDSLPLTAHGKIDRKALPAPEADAYASRPYEAPHGHVEEILAGIWQDLLHIEQVGRSDNFFELGGHSLLIVQMMERLRRVGLSTDVRRVFERATLADLADVLVNDSTTPLDVPPNAIPDDCTVITPAMLPLIDLEQVHIDSIARAVPGGAANIQDIYPLAPLQEGMLFHHLLDGEGGDTYVVTTVLRVESRARLNDLIGALQRVIDRHDILRTAVLWENLPQPVQVVYRKAYLTVDTLALDPRRRPEEQMEDWIAPERQHLDLRQAPLMRLQVAPAPDGKQWYALLQIHHIVDDGASLHLMISEVVAHLESRAEELAEPVAFRYHVGQATALARSHDSDAFFREKFGDVVEPTAPFGLLDVRGDAGRLAEARCSVSTALGERARAHARRLNVSVATLFHAAWAVIVAHTSARDDVVFGSVLLGRLQGSAGAKRIVGMFINTLPLRLRLADLSAKALVERTQRELVDLLAHEQASLATAQRHSGMGGGAPLFSAVLNFRHGAPDPHADWGSAHGIEVLAGQYRTNYPISLSVDDLGNEFLLTAQTDRRVDPEQLLRHMQVALEGLVEALELAPHTPAMSLPIISAEEHNAVLAACSGSQIGFPQEATLVSLFEAQAERTPGAEAIRSAATSLSFAQLNERADLLARYLIARGIGPDDLVGLYLERSVEMLVGVIGILKAGGAYLPLDPTYPAERIAYMLNDAAPKVVLLQEKLRDKLPANSAFCVAIDGQWDEIGRPIAVRPNAGSKLRPDHLAYVIYTSGSTGRPKGVMIEHRQVVNLWRGLDEVYRLSRPCERIALNASLNFDASVQQWIQLLSGRSLHLVPEEARRDASRLFELINTHGIHGIDCTPSQLKAWLAAGLLKKADTTLRVALVGGEAIDPDLWRTLASSARIDFYNVYGPTECTVDSTVAALVKDSSEPHIGRPMANRRVYILDGRGNPVPVGVAGEIFIGGAGVGRGYLNLPDLTNERFRSDPFSKQPNARMYSTGDMGRRRADGSIEFLGRNDTQVKIRGFRIELGEIEQQLRQHPQVSQALVVAREDIPGDKRLVAYIVADASTAVSASESASRAAGEHMLQQWRMIHEQNYTRSVDGPSFIGWNSSYTGEPIPEMEMQEWLGNTVERIQALQPRRVLEIGCGVGLLLQHLAPGCERYLGTDFSDSAIEKLGKWVSARPELGHVQLLRRAATELQELPAGAFDTVILNSVVQYFPDVDYLLEVLRESVRLLETGGTIFIGDVRRLGLLRTFHSAVQLSRAAATVSVAQLRNRIDRALSQEKELVIEPDFFVTLLSKLPGIVDADIQLKRGSRSNELTRYRYDVTLRVGSGEASPEHVVRLMKWHETTDVGLAQDLAAERLIDSSDAALEAGALRMRLSALDTGDQVVATMLKADKLCNNPLENTFRQQLLPELREYLQARLPEHMIPSAWVALRQLPLTPGGKVDHRALPAPQGRAEESGEYIAPRTPLERTLADLWAQVLRVDRVGVDDDFFRLGGHSLLATQVVVRIQATLSVETPVRLLFECPTVRQLSGQVEQLRLTQTKLRSEAELDDMDELIQQVVSLPDSEVQELMRALRTNNL